MKNLFGYCLMFIFFSCTGNLHLEKEEAASIIRAVRDLPRVFEYELNTVDPVEANKLLKAGLEESGMLSVDRTQKLKDIGKPIVHFSPKAQPYLLGVDSEYPNNRLVKVADMDLGEITAIQLLNDQKLANVEYTVIYKNMTPFSKLINRDFSEPEINRIRLAYFDTGWKIADKP